MFAPLADGPLLVMRFWDLPKNPPTPVTGQMRVSTVMFARLDSSRPT
jgi:hypothetical protein